MDPVFGYIGKFSNMWEIEKRLAKSLKGKKEFYVSYLTVTRDKMISDEG